MAELKKVKITSIDPNPHRALDTYPWIEHKVEALQRSIASVGLWEGIIVRPAGRRYEMAFGHHRLEAAKREGLTEVPVIIRDLTDQQMLEFMGRENGEDYSTEFLVMLNTWEGAVNFAGGSAGTPEVAKILGWVQQGKSREKDGTRANHIARACSHAHSLIVDGHITRSDLDGLSVNQANEILGRTRDRIQKLEQRGQKLGHTQEQIESAQQTVADAGRRTAKKAKDGKVATNDLRNAVDTEAFRGAGQDKPKKQLLFAAFGDSLANQIARTLSSDNACDKLEQIQDSLPLIEFDDDKRVVERLSYELEQLEGRAANWQKRMKVSKSVEKRVVEFKAIEGGKA